VKSVMVRIIYLKDRETLNPVLTSCPYLHIIHIEHKQPRSSDQMASRSRLTNCSGISIDHVFDAKDAKNHSRMAPSF
jgi:hypothetical protein